MASFDIHHTLEILKTAFPYMDSRTSETFELFIKAGDFYECLINRKYEVNMMTNSMENEEEFDKIDMISMLKSIRSICYENEVRIIDSILNVMNAMELYETYTDLYTMMRSQDDFNGLGDLLGFDGDFNSNGDLIELLSSMLSPEDKETLDNINMVIQMMNTSSDSASENDEPDDNKNT